MWANRHRLPRDAAGRCARGPPVPGPSGVGTGLLDGGGVRRVDEKESQPGQQ
jgi:hypothetical protein